MSTKQRHLIGAVIAVLAVTACGSTTEPATTNPLATPEACEALAGTGGIINYTEIAEAFDTDRSTARLIVATLEQDCDL